MKAARARRISGRRDAPVRQRTGSGVHDARAVVAWIRCGSVHTGSPQPTQQRNRAMRRRAV